MTSPITLIADSGSSKTAWAIVAPQTPNPESRTTNRIITTSGINPVRDSADSIRLLLQHELLPLLPQAPIAAIHFYGAGCIAPFTEPLIRVLNEELHPDALTVESDLLGAARALCGHQPGIACILGTGSNSCYYDGEKIADNVSPLGFILGDEGSGAVLGRLLVGDLLKGQLPATLRDEFLQHFSLTPADIIRRVYREPLPNKFLASLVPFIHLHIQHPGIHRLVVGAFRQFFRRNVALYARPDLPVHFVGGIAGSLTPLLIEAAEAEGFLVGRVEQNPIQRMVEYHLTNN